MSYMFNSIKTGLKGFRDCPPYDSPQSAEVIMMWRVVWYGGRTWLWDRIDVEVT